MGGEVIRHITSKRFTNILKQEFVLHENNDANDYGIYFMNRRIRRVQSQQNKNITRFLVTELGKLLPATELQWFHHITDVPQTNTSASLSPDASQVSSSPGLEATSNPASSSPANSPASPSSTSPVVAHTQLQPYTDANAQLPLSPAICTQLQSSTESTSTSLQILSSQTQHNDPFKHLTYFDSKEAWDFFGYLAPKM